MKKLILVAIAGMLCASAIAQNVVDCPYTSISSDITTNTILSAGTLYRLEGCIHVTSGVTLTIPAGTIIMGQKAIKASLIIDSGAFLLALGANNNPIVFTTDQANGYRNPGDWNGLIVNGKAYSNTTTGKITGNVGGFCSIDGGATNNMDSSGILQFIRIEYAVNGLTLNSVGSKTVVNNIQASYPSVDGFQFLGGTVKARELVVLNAARTDFYFTLGNQSKLQSLLGIRLDASANYASAPNSNGIVFANNDDVAGSFATSIYTHPVISNATLLGPAYCGATGLSSNFKNGVLYYHRTEGGIYNSVISGWPVGFRMEDATTIANANTNYTLNFAYNSLINNTTGYNSTTWSGSCAASMLTWMNGTATPCGQQGSFR